MKKMLILLIWAIIFTGCNSVDQEITQYNQENIIVDEHVQQEDEVDYLEESLKNQVVNLRLLWKAFDQERQSDRDPTQDFKNSKYLFELKHFLNKRESLALSAKKLGELLGQPDYSGLDKTIMLGARELHIRVIGYNVDFYEQVLTDITDIQNKWIFVQCWNEEEFYFNTLSDGGIQYLDEFIPLEINNMLYILISGYALPYYPHPPFIWTWRLEDNGFKLANLFESNPYQNDDYILYNHTGFDTFYYDTRWMLHTDGSYLFIERGEKGSDSQKRLMRIQYEIDKTHKTISFISTDSQEKESAIHLMLVEDVFKIVTNK